MKILVTGSAGFIGYHVVRSLLALGNDVVGIDNINSYYDVELKLDRLRNTGIDIYTDSARHEFRSLVFPSYRFFKIDLTDQEALTDLFKKEEFDIICNLAAQAGVRYSIENPYAYIQSNVVGFLNILENCRTFNIKHLVYASSSSVYGMDCKIPYHETAQTDNPVSLYAATKKSDELMAHAYSKLYKLPTTGLRLFTVYGPWGRPDMAPFLFMKAITEGKPIQVFNHGDMLRDFTYIDDVVVAITKVINRQPEEEEIPYEIYNVGNSFPVRLENFIHTIENIVEKSAIKEYKEMQPGDVQCTFADTGRLEKRFGYKPQTSIQKGVEQFYAWYKNRYLKA